MPTTLVGKLLIALELLLVLWGLVLVWRRTLARPGRTAAGQGSAPGASPDQGQVFPTTQDSCALPAWKTSGTDIAMLVWMVMCGGIFFQILSMGVLSALGIAGPALLVVVSACFQVGMLLGCFAFVRFTSTGKGYDSPKLGFVSEGFATFLITLPPIFAVGFGWQALLRAFEIPVEQQEMVGLFRSTDNLPLLGLLIALASILAPLSEELIFRAGLFRMLRGQVSRWSALLLSAALFAAVHGSLANFPQLMILGLLWALAYERSGNIAVPMFAHALFNLNTVLMVIAGLDN